MSINCSVETDGDNVRIKSTNYSSCDDCKLDLTGSGESTDVEIVRSIFNFVTDVTKITSLELTSCFLRTLPDYLIHLPLIELNISINFFKNLPSCLYNGLDKIKVLNVSQNNLNGFCVPPLCIKELCDLNISNNPLPNNPRWLTELNCPKLRYLNISSIKLDTPDIGFKKLEKLIVRNCYLKDFGVVSNINDLITLNISNTRKYFGNDINELYFNEFSSCNTLRELDLRYLNLFTLPESISELRVLERLDVSNNFLSELPRSISKICTLRILNISHNEVITLPSDLDTITEIYLSHNLISDIPEYFKDSKVLNTFDGYQNYFTESILDLLKNDSIKRIDLEQNYFDTTKIVSNIKQYEAQKKLFRTRINENRINGPINNLDSSDSVSECSDVVPQVECVVNDNEENWDDYDIDEDLYIHPDTYKMKPKPPNNHYDIKFLDPSYYEDAPDDTT